MNVTHQPTVLLMDLELREFAQTLNVSNVLMMPIAVLLTLISTDVMMEHALIVLMMIIVLEVQKVNTAIWETV